MELRMYSFVNFYLSSIQQGIQSGHCSDELSLVYLELARDKYPEQQKLFVEWLNNHKTIIVLNGGDHKMIMETWDKLIYLCNKLELPHGCFQEPGLGDIITCCNVVVPARYFSAVKKDGYGFLSEHYFYEDSAGKKYEYEIYSTEYQFIELIKSRPLAK